jgi:hypothetical protein
VAAGEVAAAMLELPLAEVMLCRKWNPLRHTTRPIRHPDAAWLEGVP